MKPTALLTVLTLLTVAGRSNLWAARCCHEKPKWKKKAVLIPTAGWKHWIHYAASKKPVTNRITYIMGSSLCAHDPLCAYMILLGTAPNTEIYWVRKQTSGCSGLEQALREYGCGVPFWSDENVLKLIIVIAAQFCEYTRNLKLQLKWVSCMKGEYT